LGEVGTQSEDLVLANGQQFKLGGGFKYVLFSSLFGEDFQFDEYFSNGLKPPPSKLILVII